MKETNSWIVNRCLVPVSSSLIFLVRPCLHFINSDAHISQRRIIDDAVAAAENLHFRRVYHFLWAITNHLYCLCGQIQSVNTYYVYIHVHTYSYCAQPFLSKSYSCFVRYYSFLDSVTPLVSVYLVPYQRCSILTYQKQSNTCSTIGTVRFTLRSECQMLISSFSAGQSWELLRSPRPLPP